MLREKENPAGGRVVGKRMVTTYDTETSTEVNTRLLKEALSWAEEGFPVFPVYGINGDGRCMCGDPECSRQGKHPIGQLVPHGRNDASVDPETIRGWWKQAPRANLAMPTGSESGLFVLDIDGAGGATSLDQLIEARGDLPETWAATTGNGRHVYFSLPDGENIPNSAGKIAPGLDIRGEGGYIVVPPSRHHSGRTYKWEDGGDPTEVELAEPPAWLTALAKESPTHSADSGERQGPFELPEKIPQGQRNDALFREVRRLKAKRLSDAEIRSFVQSVNRDRCAPPLPEKELEQLVKHALIYKESPADRGNVIRGAFGRLEKRDPAILEDEAFLSAMAEAQDATPALYEEARQKAKGMVRPLEKAVKAEAAKSKKPGEEKEPQYTALLPSLVDIVRDQEGATAFLFRTEAGLTVQGRIEEEGEAFLPPPGNQIPAPLPRADQVLELFDLESQFPPAQADGALFDDLLTYFKGISELPGDRYYLLLTVWTLHTYLLDQFEYSPIMCFFAVPERGKSRTGKALTYVCYRGLHTETLRDAYLVRFSHNLQGTIFFDLRNAWRKAEKTGTEDLLLGRFEKGMQVPRVLYPDRGPFRDTVFYNIYGPTLIATNEPIHRILGSRCVSLNMPESTQHFPDDVTKDAALPLKERCLSFRARHMGDQLPAIAKIARGRLGDIIRPLHQIIRLVKPDLEGDFLELVQELEKERKADKGDSFEAKVLGVMIDLAGDTQIDDQGRHLHLKNGLLPLGDIADEINEGLPEKSHVTPHRIGSIVKSLGLEKSRMHGGRVAVVWDEEKISQIKEPYGL